MDLLTTDDAARRLEFAWRGDPGSAFPFETRYSSLAAFVVVSVATFVLTGFVTSPLLLAKGLVAGLVLQFLAASAMAVVVPIFVVRRWVRLVTRDEPYTHHWRVFCAERKTPRARRPHTATIHARIARPAATIHVVDARGIQRSTP